MSLRLLKRLRDRVDLKRDEFGKIYKYLRFFGDISTDATADDFVAAVKNVQKLVNQSHPKMLKVDGIAGPRTYRVLQQVRRCKHRHGREEQRSGGYWGLDSLQVYIHGRVRELSKSQVNDAAERVFAECAANFGLQIELTTSRAKAHDIISLEPIDGKYGTLGIHDICPRDYTGVLRGELDSYEPWTERKFYQVLLHEFGWHGLGEYHWKGRSRSIGEAYHWDYDGYTESDIVVMRKKYGEPSSSPPGGTQPSRPVNKKYVLTVDNKQHRGTYKETVSLQVSTTDD